MQTHKTNERKTEDNVKIFQTILEVFSEDKQKIKVQAYWDDQKQEYIDVVICPDKPFDHVISYATIALSDFSIGKEVNGVPLRVEFVGACYDEFDLFPKMVATCAYLIIKEHSTCYPGCIYPDVVSLYMPDSPMKHILFRSPFGWEKDFTSLHFPNKMVAWLLMVPISDQEYQYSRENGSDKLESLFMDQQINIYDLARKSIL